MSEARRPIIVMLTSRFPFGPGEQFIESELPHWADAGVDLVVVPEKNDHPGSPVRPVPPGIDVDTRLTRRWASPGWRALGALEALRSPVLRRDLAQLRRMGLLDARHAGYALRTAIQVAVVRRMLRRIAAERGGIDVAYAYWLSVSADAAALERGAKGGRGGQGVRRAVARTHNADVYEERHPLRFHPVVRQIAGDLDLLAPIASDGGRHAVERYGFSSHQVRVSRLGVSLPGPTERCLATGDGEFTVVSVSTMTPFKRLDLLIDSLAVLADLCPGVHLSWRHFGAGPLHDELARRVEKTLEPRGVTVEWMGQRPNGELLAWYLDHRVDVLVNTSSSEGIPVSMMEAMARGVPVIGTDVGGVREILPADWLMDADPTPSQVAGFIAGRAEAAKDPGVREQMAARIAERYDADANYRRFIDMLTGLAGRA